MSVLREGKAGRSWQCQSQALRAHLRAPALDSLGICLVTPKVTMSLFSFAGSSGATGRTGQQGEWCKDQGDTPAMPLAGRKGFWVVLQRSCCL